jgi:hypothetical protein
MNNKVYINDPRIMRSEKDIHQERTDYANCPMESSIPCASSKNDAVFSRDIIQHDNNNELFRGIHEANLLNTAYFSQRNINNIQNAIRRNVYEISQGKYLIARQSVQELENIMRYIYIDYSLNSMTDIKGQIKSLNDRVIKESVLKILPNIRFHQYYLDDKFSERTLIDIPKNMSTYGTKTTPFLNRF